MKENVTKFCWRSCLVFLETVTVVLAVLAVIAGILLWRLTASPLPIPFAEPAIENALRNPERGIYVKMDSVALHWPDLKGPLYLGLSNARVYGADDHEIVSVGEAGLALSKTALLSGRIAPTSIVLRKPVLQVVRSEDGKINVGFGGVERADEQTALMNRILEFVSKPGDENENTPLATMHAFEIQEAAVSIEDRMLDVSWSVPRFDGAFLSTDEGLKSSLAVVLPEWDGKNGTVKADLNYRWEAKTSDLRAQVNALDLAMIGAKFPQARLLAQQDMSVDVKIAATLDPDFMPVEARADVSSAQGAINIEELSKQPLPYSDMRAIVTYDREEQAYRLSEAAITTKDVTFEGGADLTRDETGKIAGPVNVWIDELAHEQIDPLWPETLRGDNAENWIVHRMADGILRNVKASLHLEATKGAQDEEGQTEEGWNIETKNVVASFDFENLKADYRSPLWPVTKGKGKGVFDVDGDKLVIDVDEGMIGELAVKEAKLEFTDIIAEGKGMAKIDVKLSGPLRNVLGYIENEPLAVAHSFDKEAVKGTVDLHVKLEFPAREDVKTSEVKYDITGTANEIGLPDVVQGLELTGGPFNIAVKDNEAVVSGKGKLARRDIDVRWQEFVESEGQKYTSKINAKLVADEGLRSEFGIDLSDFIAGNVPIEVAYTEYGDGRADAYVSADMGPAKFFVEPFGYEKSPGQGGGAKAKAILKNGELVRIENLIANAPSFRLEDTTLTFEGTGGNMSLRRGEISRFTLGQTVAKAEFEKVPMRGGGPEKLKIGVTGPFFDLRPFLSAQEEGEGKTPEEYNEEPLEISVAADSLRTSDDDVIQYGKIYADIDAKGRFNQLEFDAIAGTVSVPVEASAPEDGEKKAGDKNAKPAMVTKPGEIYLRFKEDEKGMRTFRLEADDAGATLKAFQVYDNIKGGRLVVYAEPVRGVYDRNLVGTAEITDFRVVKAPGLARLLGALSLPGMLELLGNEGVAFSKLESKFEWRYRPQGGLLVMKEGRTSGNSLGLTFDGVVDNPAGTIDVTGTLVPISGVNNILGSIPLIGDILTGGTGGVFAATYSVKGKLEEPDISVNPLSVLAPGILRRILFE